MIKKDLIVLNKINDSETSRKFAEEHFHDEWALSEDYEQINVIKRNEAATAPEMRFIKSILGDIGGKTILDVGCGLGEVSVYFALQGAEVTATDISSGMCEITKKLATKNGVNIKTHVSAIEDFGLPKEMQYDVIYTGNTLHHANIELMLGNILPHLKNDGIFVSWDPVAYNPVINIYRAIANKVRTADEHPLRRKDIELIKSNFANSEVKWFWLTTLIIFILMVIVQFRSPNKERFWKKVIDESEKWLWLYIPLEALDRFILKLFPLLGYLCWNVAIIGKNKLKR